MSLALTVSDERKQWRSSMHSAAIPDELERLDAQARSIAAPTELLLRAAGIEPGMSVLDLGTGLGHVACAVAALVGSDTARSLGSIRTRA